MSNYFPHREKRIYEISLAAQYIRFAFKQPLVRLRRNRSLSRGAVIYLGSNAATYMNVRNAGCWRSIHMWDSRAAKGRQWNDAYLVLDVLPATIAL